ncbi:uncharacterized protein BXZ73DRAFT_48783 [Epithele typhae]|uniref:uncharacterized protein n=1 Tax=Epithele typhae TaxID=378194 RepID=UPI002008941D|nr:uncharacterized protein BXZ73DRAFT_48783 [Epithele typhae]KAH9927512.1 hypothetical protein BXZ73DRAFT_48783 [Epithele typhae]
MAGTQPEALKLKNEGNELFTNNDFSAAYHTYSAAIKLDPDSAVLYCNRAACAYNLSRYLDACTDARKATELDPTYAKAWGRLAAQLLLILQSMDRYTEAINCWKRAIAALPDENLTPAQAKQREGYESDLAAVEAKFEHMKANPKMPEGMLAYPNDSQDLRPWQRASRIVAELERKRFWRTCVSASHTGHREWERALTQLNAAHAVPGPRGEEGWFAYRGVLEGFTNALIADERIFRMSDANIFLEQLQRQMAWEAHDAKAWTAVGAQKVIEEIPGRLENEGWSSVRPALAVTVRSWILRAFLKDGLEGNPAGSLDVYTSALEVLKWAAEKYKDVPSEERGTVLQPTFIRGVKAMRLNQYMKASLQTSTRARLPLEGMIAGADELIEELKDVSMDADDAVARGENLGFWYAFHRYPNAMAHGIRGYVFNKQALKLREEAGGLTPEAYDLFFNSADEYIQSAMLYPLDDSHHVWFFHCALEGQYNAEAPAWVLLRTLDEISQDYPIAGALWEHSADWPQMKPALDRDMDMREDLQSSIDAGDIDRDLPIKLKAMSTSELVMIM